MDLQTGKKMIDKLYEGIDGFRIADSAFKKMNHYYIGYEYGEAKFESFYQMLNKIKPKQNDVFYDLGSGVGKKVFIASLLFGIKTAVGLEIINDLYIQSKLIKEKYFSMIRPEKNSNKIDFYNVDFDDYDFSDASILYLSIAPYALEIEFTGKLRNKLNSLTVGSKLITSNIPFVSDKYNIEGNQEFDYIKGKGIVFFHEKIK